MRRRGDGRSSRGGIYRRNTQGFSRFALPVASLHCRRSLAETCQSNCLRALCRVMNRREGTVMAESIPEKCAHPGCNCPAASDSKYCGAYCEARRSRATACMRSVAPARRWRRDRSKGSLRQKTYGQAASSASHPTVEAGSANRRSGAKTESAPAGAAKETREVTGAWGEGVKPKHSLLCSGAVVHSRYEPSGLGDENVAGGE